MKRILCASIAVVLANLTVGAMTEKVTVTQTEKVTDTVRTAEKVTDTVRARITGTNGVVRLSPLEVTVQADGGRRFALKAADAGPDVKWVDLLADCAVARTGEDGFWMALRGVAGDFTRTNGTYVAPRNWLTLPYFAMRTPRGSFLAVMEGMRFEFDVRLDVKDGVYTMYPRWQVGEIGTGAYDEMAMVIYDLPAGSDYNAMAKAYRRYKLARTPSLKPLKERARTRPNLAQLARSIPVRQNCCAKPWDRKKHNKDYTTETEPPVTCHITFAAVLENLRKMKALGIDDVAVCLGGWQTGGYDGRCPSVFPVAPEPGGEAELRALIAGAKELGYLIDAHDNYTDCYSVSDLWNDGAVACLSPGGAREVNGVWSGGRAYNLCLKNAWEDGFLRRDLARTAKLGFWGCHYIDVFTAAFPYRCCDARHRANRAEQMAYQVKTARLCHELFGGFASECCYDHILEYVDYINYATAKMRDARRVKVAGKTLMWDRVVPFWELAFHDYVLSTPDKITQEVLGVEENLILVEFGGRPIFYSFNGDKRIAAIKKAWDQFKTLRHLQLEEMVTHTVRPDGFIRVVYGNGETVEVNPTATPLDGVPARSFRLVKP